MKLRTRFFNALQDKELAKSEESFLNSGCFFKGIPVTPKNHEDTNHVTEQESTFWYLFGVKETDCYVLLTPSQEKDETGHYKHHTVLFVPRYEEIYRMWMFVKSKEEFLSQNKVEEVFYVDEIGKYFAGRKLGKIYLYSGINSDSGISVAEPDE